MWLGERKRCAAASSSLKIRVVMSVSVALRRNRCLGMLGCDRVQRDQGIANLVVPGYYEEPFAMIEINSTNIIVTMKWRVILEPDPETSEWAIWCPELPGCTSAGVTQEEALNNIREAIELYLQRDTIQLLPGAVIREVILG